jgi:tetratricopeptide (TPR) repeat protein
MTSEQTADDNPENPRGNFVWKIVAPIGMIFLAWLVQRLIVGDPLVQQMRDAELAMWEGRYVQALALYGEMIKNDPNWYWPYSGRGETYRLMGDPDRALADLDQAIRLKSDGEEEPYYRRCQLFAVKGDNDKALADCETSLRIKPDQVNVLLLMGKILFERGEFDRTAEMYSNVIRVTQGLADPYFYRGQILLFGKNQPEQAANDLAQAAKIAFEYRGIGATLLEQSGQTPPDRDLMSSDHPFMPDGIYTLIWLHIARVRAGQDDSQELAGNLEELGKPIWKDLTFRKFENITNEVIDKSLAPWPAPIFGLFAGKITPESLRLSAESSPDPDVRKRRICDVDFYLAEISLAKNEPAQGRQLLSAAGQGCPPAAREAGFARQELKRLGF